MIASPADLELELAAMRRLHAVATRLIEGSSREGLLQEILDAAIDVVRADKGFVQLYDPQCCALRVMVQRGFTPEFLRQFEVVTPGMGACGTAMREHRRVIVEDAWESPLFAPYRDLVVAAGFRGVQATPLVSREGELLGMLSTHLAEARPPSERDLRLLDLLARQAADFIERARTIAAAEAAADRTARLQRLTALLAEAITPEDAARVICRQSVGTLGAAAAFVWLLAPDGRRLELVCVEGYQGPAIEAYRAIPLDAALPVTDALRRRDIVLLGDSRTRVQTYPALGDGAGGGFHAWAAVPLATQQETFGAFSLSFAEERAFGAEDIAFLRTVAQQCTQTIVRARLFDAERTARARAERVAEQSRRLLAMTAQLSHRLPAHEIAAMVVRESAAALGSSFASMWILDAAGEHLELLASVGDELPDRFARLPLDALSPLTAAVMRRAPIYLANAEEHERHFPLSKERLADITPRDFAAACLPLVAEGRVTGGLAFSFPHTHALLEDERTFLEVLANQCAQALDRAQLLAQERAANAAHAESNRTLNAIISASPAAITLLDLDGTVRLWNPAAERIFGWPASEVLGHFLPTIPEESRARFLEALARISTDVSVMGTETRRKTRDRGTIDVSLWAAPVQRPDGAVQCLALVVDITDRKKAEKDARDADRRKDEFLAMLGHELRNPLAPIMTALQLMALRGLSGGEREREIIERQTRHLVRLVDDLLDISRITRGKIELRRTRADLAAILARAVEMASPLLEQRKHHLQIAAPRGIYHVDGDEARLAQVFQNLLTNAAKYTPPGGQIAVRLASSDGAAVIEVADNGDGIPPHLLPSIFDPFVQGERSVDRSQGGLGLGLALVHSLVALHGGTVLAHSEGAGKGSRFVVSLPLASEAAQVATGVAPGDASLHGAHRRRVLLVDDNPDAAETLAELLRSAGHQVFVAHDGPTALAQAHAFRPHVALLDIGLPVMDGYELARKLRSSLPAAPLRLVALTGYGQEHDRRRSLEAGFAEHLVKPVEGTQLLAAVHADECR
jgi:PAS domain S-box-containing protein